MSHDSRNTTQHLLPCPFCGTVPEVRRIGNDLTKRKITIRCPKCRIERTTGAIHRSMDWLLHVATEEWNARFSKAEIAPTNAATLAEENVILTDVLNQARETLLVSINGTLEDLQRSLGKLSIVCKSHWDWNTERFNMNAELSK